MAKRGAKPKAKRSKSKREQKPKTTPADPQPIVDAPGDAQRFAEMRRRFVAAYIRHPNATQAAIEAGYSENSAGSQAHELLKRPDIAQAIEDGLERLRRKYEITTERVLQEYARIAFADIRDVVKFGPGGVRIVDCETLTEDQAAAVAEVSETTTEAGGSQRVKMHSKPEALAALARQLDICQAKTAGARAAFKRNADGSEETVFELFGLASEEPAQPEQPDNAEADDPG